MTNLDPEQEFSRLAEIYSRMADEQLEQVALDYADLTDVAQQALRAEFDKRKLALPAQKAEAVASVVKEPPESIPATEDSEARASVDYRELVEIRRFRDLLDAEVAKGALDSAGIESFLGDDNMVRMDWFYSNAVGGVKLLVRPGDFTAAEEVLNQPIPEEIDYDGETPFAQPMCPKCGSLDITFETLNKPVAYGSAWLGVPLPIKSEKWTCNACGARWVEEEDEAPKPGEVL